MKINYNKGFMIKKIISDSKTFISSHWKKIILLLIVVVIVGGLIINQNKKAKNGLTYSKIERRDINEIVSASGKVKADEEVTLKFQTSGQLSWVGVKKGDYVQKWQAIASLDKEKLEKELKQYLIDYMNERTDLEQTRENYRDKALDALADLAANRVKNKAQFDMDRTVLDVEISNIALKYATIVTPIEGIVTKIDTPYPGVNIVYTAAEFTIANPNKLVFKGNVDEADIGKVQTGQKVRVTLDAYPEDSFEATVQQIEFTPTLTSGGGTAYAVKLELPPNENERFKLEMNGDAEVTVAQASQVLAVPQEAVREETAGKYIWVKTNNQPVKKTVEVGLSDDNWVQIKSGLTGDEEIVTAGFKNLEK
jgi:RND family efflux transporter MFP subunit